MSKDLLVQPLAAELKQGPKIDTYWKALFCTLSSSTNLVLNAVPIATGQCLWRSFPLLTKKRTFFESKCILKEVKIKWKIFRQL